jgi:AmmeMemoRadiSam system protein B
VDRPKLRNVERIGLLRDGTPHLVLRDPMSVAETIAIDADFAPVLDAFDGTRTLSQIRQSLLMGRGLDVALEDLRAFAKDLEAAGLLDGDAFRARWLACHDAFFAAAARPPMLAGTLYPDDTVELRELLRDTVGPIAPSGRTTRAVLLPHGPLEMTGPILAATLPALPPRSAIDTVVLLGADHHPALLPFAVLDKPYATPLGVVPCATKLVGALARRIDWLDREAIRHRVAHSLEWASIYLQHAWSGDVPPCVPIVCGAAAIVDHREAHDGVAELVASIDGLLDDERVLVVVAAELAHAGGAYGRPALDPAGLATVEARDRAVLDAVVRGRPRDVLARAEDPLEQGRPSGLPALLVLSELVTGMRGEACAYALTRVPGDSAADGDGWAGLAGAAFRAP